MASSYFLVLGGRAFLDFHFFFFLFSDGSRSFSSYTDDFPGLPHLSSRSPWQKVERAEQQLSSDFISGMLRLR